MTRRRLRRRKLNAYVEYHWRTTCWSKSNEPRHGILGGNNVRHVVCLVPVLRRLNGSYKLTSVGRAHRPKAPQRSLDEPGLGKRLSGSAKGGRDKNHSSSEHTRSAENFGVTGSRTNSRIARREEMKKKTPPCDFTDKPTLLGERRIYSIHLLGPSSHCQISDFGSALRANATFFLARLKRSS